MAARYDKATNRYLFELERAKLACRVCVACGDPTGDRAARIRALLAEGRWPHQDEWLYCQECADEKFRKKLSAAPARLFSSGGGCPLEPNADDTGPWGENAIRDLEDG